MALQIKLRFLELVSMIPDEALTHSGSFHSDDVFSAAFLQILNPRIVIKRVSKVPEDYRGLVFDIGGGRFDHHQVDKRYRENNVPYAAFGLLWESFGKCVVSEADVKRFDLMFVQDLDLSDNTGSKSVVADMIADFNPVWNSNEDVDANFALAVSVAKQILERQFLTMTRKEEATKLVQSIMEEQQATDLLELSEHIPWKDAVKNTSIYYVIYPSNRGGYMVQAVADDEKAPLTKHPFPENWRGQNQETLIANSGIAGLRFCHPSGFLCGTDSLEAAKQVAERMLCEIRAK